MMFTKAITRKPCRTLINGISTAQFGEGTPDYELALEQHAKYVQTLESLGLTVTSSIPAVQSPVPNDTAESP